MFTFGQEPTHHSQHSKYGQQTPQYIVTETKQQLAQEISAKYRTQTANHHNETHAHGINVRGKEFHWNGADQTTTITNTHGKGK